MNHKLYYTVQKETLVLDPNHGGEILTGWKYIVVYQITNDRPKDWFAIKTDTTNNTEDEINSWLEENGFGGREYSLIEL